MLHAQLDGRIIPVPEPTQTRWPLGPEQPSHPPPQGLWVLPGGGQGTQKALEATPLLQAFRFPQFFHRTELPSSCVYSVFIVLPRYVQKFRNLKVC